MQLPLAAAAAAAAGEDGCAGRHVGSLVPFLRVNAQFFLRASIACVCCRPVRTGRGGQAANNDKQHGGGTGQSLASVRSVLITRCERRLNWL